MYFSYQYRFLWHLQKSVIPVTFALLVTKISYSDTEQRIINQNKAHKLIVSTSASLSEKIEVDRNLIDTEVNNDDHWHKKATECSFCRQFLLSPCKYPFKRWSKCVDLAKEQELDFTMACQDYSAALFTCMEEEREYFELTRAKEQEERNDEQEGDEEYNRDTEDSEDENDTSADSTSTSSSLPTHRNTSINSESKGFVQ